MRDLRIQLLVSHLVLVGLMLVVMIGAVVNFFHLGRSIDRILKDNYASVIVAQDMKDGFCPVTTRLVKELRTCGRSMRFSC